MKELDLKNRRFPCFDDVINIVLPFLTNNVPFFQLFFKYFAFLTQIRKKCAISKVSTKIELWILADKACCFTNFSNITS